MTIDLKLLAAAVQNGYALRWGQVEAVALELVAVRVEARNTEHGPCLSQECCLWRGHEVEWEHCADLARLADARRTR